MIFDLLHDFQSIENDGFLMRLELTTYILKIHVKLLGSHVF